VAIGIAAVWLVTALWLGGQQKKREAEIAAEAAPA
jgi:hypothetical protein